MLNHWAHAPEHVTNTKDAQIQSLEESRRTLLLQTQAFADEVAHRPDEGQITAPLDDLERMKTLGLLTAFLPLEEGGLALAEPSGQAVLLRLLAAIGGADLVLGRLFEGHVNALLLMQVYATKEQKTRAAADARAGMLFGVWNTGAPDLLRLVHQDAGFSFTGVKTFASGAAFVQRPIVTAELPERGWQMTLPRMEQPQVANALQVNRDFWHPLGMEASESFEVNFTGAYAGPEDLIGAPGDFYREPLFRGGAIRFAAVHAGAVVRLHTSFVEWLRDRRRESDPYQIARLGETSLLAREAALWVQRASAEAERRLRLDAPKHAVEEMVEFANAMRLAIERLATAMMNHITVGIGAHGLLRPHRFGRMLRDLTMYLRQPAPDQTLAEVGRAALRNLAMRAGGAAHGLWSGAGRSASIPPSYFDGVYKDSSDPWKFETSPYEAAKYEASIRVLPRDRYVCGWEIGCSIGVLTRKLASRCESLLGTDVSVKALDAARERCADLPQVKFEQVPVPPEAYEHAHLQGSFDLIVLSEVGYYWGEEDLHRAATLIAAHQTAGGHLLLVHLTEFVPDYPLPGDQVHELWLNRPEWRPLAGSRHERYRIDLLERV